MNPLDWITANLRLAAVAAAALALISALYWMGDKVGDSRELDVREKLSKQETKTNEAAEAGRNRARACHAHGADWLWNVGKAQCERIVSVPQPRP